MSSRVINTLPKLTGFAKGTARNEQGVAMVEFALILPILMILLVGGIEITRLVLFNQKIDNATSRIADAITRLDKEVVECKGTQGLLFYRNDLMVQMMKPYDFNGNGGGLIVSAIEAEYKNQNKQDDNSQTQQKVKWQWVSGESASRIGSKNSVANGAEWPLVFRRSPNDGGMFDGDRIIAVEVFYTYKTIIPGIEFFLGMDAVTQVYKKAFYRARFGNMGRLAPNC